MRHDLSGRDDANPCDLLDDATKRLGAVALIFLREGPVDIGETERAGIYRLLDHIVWTLFRAGEICEKAIAAPMADGYRKGAERAADEYRRGAKDGRAQLLRALADAFPHRAQQIKEVADGIDA